MEVIHNEVAFKYGFYDATVFKTSNFAALVISTNYFQISIKQIASHILSTRVAYAYGERSTKNGKLP